MFVGIDIGKNRHQAAFLDNSGKELCPSIPFENSDEGYSLFFNTLDSVSDGSPVVGMEATGHYWLNLYAALLARDMETHVINPIQTDAMRRMNIRKTKTDGVDCRYVAQVIRMGDFSDVAVQDSDIAELRQLCRYRYGLVDSVSALKNQITGILDRIFPEYMNLFSDIFGVTSMELLKRYTTPDALSKVPTKRLSEFLAKYSRGMFGEGKANEIKEACKRSVGIGDSNAAFIFQLQQQIRLVEFSQSQIALLEERMENCYTRFPCYLHTIKGVGVISAAVILSEIGDISRFENPRKLVAFAGIDPSVYQSGNYTAASSHMSKRGSPYLRRALWSVAENASRTNPVFADFYDRKRKEGKDHRTAVGACTRKLCYIVFAVLRDQVPFDPNFSA